MGSPRKKKFTVVTRWMLHPIQVTHENELSAAGAVKASTERLLAKFKPKQDSGLVVAVFRGHLEDLKKDVVF